MKNKVAVKKPMFSKHSLDNPSSLKVPIPKKDPKSFMEESTKEDAKIKQNIGQNLASPNSHVHKPSFLKGKIEKNEEISKKKDELDKIIYEKYKNKEKVKTDKKVDGRQSFNEKYHDYF